MLICVCAFNIDLIRIQQFIKYNQLPFQNHQIYFYGDKEIDNFPNNYKFFKSNSSHFKDGIFCKSKALNSMIKVGIKNGYSKIMTADIDIIFSKESLAIASEWVNNDCGCRIVCSDIDCFPTIKHFDSEFWKILPKRWVGKGILIFTSDTWLNLKGFNENLFGWGHEDTDVYNRAKELISVYDFDLFPTYHVNHSPRGQYYPKRLWENKKLIDKDWDFDI